MVLEIWYDSVGGDFHERLVVMLKDEDRSRVVIIGEGTLDTVIYLAQFWSVTKQRWTKEYADAVPEVELRAMTPENRAKVMKAGFKNLGMAVPD